MTDNTNDPVGVLREALEACISALEFSADHQKFVGRGAQIGAYNRAIQALLAVHVAAIQHSEQRETVPAGGDFDGLRKLAEAATPGPWIQSNKKVPYVKAIGHDSYLLHTMPIGEAAADFHPDTRARWLRDAAYIAAANPAAILRLLDRLAPPVAAPVPEAKAEQNSASNNSSMSGVEAKDEQVYQWLVRVSKCGMQNIEMSARDLMDYYEGAEPEAAPAVKHEASELPVPVTCQIYGHVVGHCGECNLGADDDINATNAVLADNYRKLTLAPPIAVQGSIADDAELDDICRAFHEAWSHDDRQAAENRLRAYIDSRSPVWQRQDTHRCQTPPLSRHAATSPACAMQRWKKRRRPAKKQSTSMESIAISSALMPSAPCPLPLQALMRRIPTMNKRVEMKPYRKQKEWLSSDLLHSAPSAYWVQVNGRNGAQLEHPGGGPLTWVRCPHTDAVGVVRFNGKWYWEIAS